MHRLFRSAAATAAALVLLMTAFAPLASAAEEPDVVHVMHILIRFKGATNDGDATRSRGQAAKIADKLVEMAREDGADFEDLMVKYSEDRPAAFILVNEDVPEMVEGGRKRSDMVIRFGDVAFGLEVGEVGLAKHHAALSPFGYHIIKRIK